MYYSCVCVHGWGCVGSETGFPGGSTVKNLPAMQETQVRSLSQEDPLEEEMANQPSILTWKIPWNRGACQATVHRVAKSWTQQKQLSMYAPTVKE